MLFDRAKGLVDRLQRVPFRTERHRSGWKNQYSTNEGRFSPQTNTLPEERVFLNGELRSRGNLFASARVG